MRRCAIMGQSSLCVALAKNTGWGQGILWFLDLHVSGFGILRFQKQYYFSFDICIFTGRVAGGVNGEKFRCPTMLCTANLSDPAH